MWNRHFDSIWYFEEKTGISVSKQIHKSESSENRILSKPDIFKGIMVILFCQFPLYIYMVINILSIILYH